LLRRVFEKRVLRSPFGPKRDEVTGEWIKLRNKEHSDLYCSPSIIQVIKSRRMRWAGYVARMGEERRIQGFGGQTGGLRWEGNIKIDLQVVVCGGKDWFHKIRGISCLAEN